MDAIIGCYYRMLLLGAIYVVPYKLSAPYELNAPIFYIVLGVTLRNLYKVFTLSP